MTSQLTLLLGRAGTGKTERLLRDYRLVQQDSRNRRQIGRGLWLAPTHRAQQAIVERLHTDEKSVQLAPGVLTFDVFAAKILAAAGHSASPISPVMKRLLLRRIVSELHAEGSLTSFESVVHTSGFLDVVAAFISELKREEIWPDDFLTACASRSGARSRRDTELGRIYQRYQDRLAEQNWYDNEGRFWLARQALADGVRGPFANVEFLAVDGFADFTQTQSEILGLLMTWIPRATITLPLEHPTSRPDLFSKPNVALAQLIRHLPDGASHRIESLTTEATDFPAGLSRIALGLFTNPRENQPTADASGVTIVAATGPVGEREAVARRIKQLLEEGVPPKQIVVTPRSISEDGRIWGEFLKEAGIPTWSEAKAPLTGSPIVKAVFSLLQLEQEDWPFDRLMSVLDSNYFLPDWPEAQGDRAIRTVAAALRRLKLHAGRELMLRVLSRVAAGQLSEKPCGNVDDDDEDVIQPDEASVRNLAAVAGPLLSRLSVVTERLRRSHTLSDWADVISALGRELGWSKIQLTNQGAALSQEASDWDLLQRIIRTAAEADEALTVSKSGKDSRKPVRLKLSDFIAELRDLLSGETIPISSDPGGCVRVLDVEQARHLSIPHLFVVGLSESAFPQNRSDDCLFTDSERRELAASGLALRHRELHHQDEMFLFYNLVTKSLRSLTLSYPAVNHKGQPVFSSPYVTALRALFTADALPIISEGQLDPVPHVDRALTATDLRLVAMTSARADQPGLFNALLAKPEWQRVGWNLLAALDTNTHRFQTRGFTCYEGRLEIAENLIALQKRFGPQHQFSATELEDYARCPFHFWLGKVLKLNELPTPEEGTDHAARGSLIHDVLAELLVNGLDADEEQIASQFRELVEEKLSGRFHETDLQRALTRIEAELLGQWGDAFAKQQSLYREKLDAAWTGRCPSLPPEIAFGSLPDTTSDTKPSHDPIVFGNDGRDVRVRGRIDRVDVGLAAGQTVFTVIDYKTGRPPKSNEAELRTGRAIQLALYTMAIRRLGLAGPDAVPFQMGYWALKETGFKRGYQRETKSFDGLDASVFEALEQTLETVIPKLAEGLRSGKFLVENADRDCTGHCPYHTTCRVNQLRPVADSLHKIGDILL